MTSSRLPATALAAVPLLLAMVPAPKATGVLPGEYLVPPNLTSAFPACGFCHDPLPNANGRMNLTITPGALSVSAGASVPVNVSVTGGPNQGFGGFCIESNGGAFQAGSTTRTSTTGDAITHQFQFFNSWSFTWQAPATPGLVKWTAAGQSADGDISPVGDSYGFWGPDSAVPGVPLRLFVNAPNVTPFGSGCAGTDRHVPVIGAAAAATIGQTFQVELHAAPAGALSICALGDSNTQLGAIPLPLDLGLLNAPGCALRTSLLVSFNQVTTGTGSGGGTATYGWPIPNDPTLRNLVLFFQVFVVDPVNGLGLTVTNGLRATLQ